MVLQTAVPGIKFVGDLSPLITTRITSIWETTVLNQYLITSLWAILDSGMVPFWLICVNVLSLLVD